MYIKNKENCNIYFMKYFFLPHLELSIIFKSVIIINVKKSLSLIKELNSLIDFTLIGKEVLYNNQWVYLLKQR